MTQNQESNTKGLLLFLNVLAVAIHEIEGQHQIPAGTMKVALIDSVRASLATNRIHAKEMEEEELEFVAANQLVDSLETVFDHVESVYRKA